MVLSTVSVAFGELPVFPDKFPPKANSTYVLVDSGNFIQYDMILDDNTIDKKAVYWTYQKPNGDLDLYVKYYETVTKTQVTKKGVKTTETWELKAYRIVNITEESNLAQANIYNFNINKELKQPIFYYYGDSPLMVYNDKRINLLLDHYEYVI